MVSLNIHIPDGFLQEEIRCDYVVSQKMKEIWAIELDLLAQLQHVCEKLKIQYYACGGTLLGAVRHKGFIPWDDDIDVTMTRADYKKLTAAYKLFEYPYELQFFDATEGYLTGHAQLRNTQTTGVLSFYPEAKFKIPYNQGIFIDIFPLDAIPDQEDERKEFIKKIKKQKSMAEKAYHITEGYIPEKANLKHKILHMIWQILPRRFSFCSYYENFMNLCELYNNKQTEYLTMLSFMPTNEKLWIKRSDLLEAEDVPFEFMKIHIEKAFDSVLKVQYGDYMVPINGGSYHGGVIFDTNMSFDEWKFKKG